MDKKRIYKNDFNETLKKIMDISDKERQYLNQVFGSDLIDGLTEFELKEKINRLTSNRGDILDQWELQKVKNKILGSLGK